jgi:hypothetical protein
MSNVRDQEIRSVALAHAAHKASFSAQVLQLVDEQRMETLVAIAQDVLVNSLVETGRLSDAGGALEGATPNLVHGVQTARNYAASNGLGGVRQADRFLDRIAPGP